MPGLVSQPFWIPSSFRSSFPVLCIQITFFFLFFFFVFYYYYYYSGFPGYTPLFRLLRLSLSSCAVSRERSLFSCRRLGLIILILCCRSNLISKQILQCLHPIPSLQPPRSHCLVYLAFPTLAFFSFLSFLFFALPFLSFPFLSFRFFFPFRLFFPL